MDLVTIGIIALVISAPIVVWDLVTAENSRLKESLLPYTQFAYLACFIAGFGLLLKTMSFAAVLLLATAVTGVIWLWDRYTTRHERTFGRVAPTGAAGQAESAAGPAQSKPADKRVPIWRELGASFFPVILIVFAVRSFLVEPFRIPSGSMIPTLLVGDFILVNKFAYDIRLPVINKKLVEIGDPQRGDVMVFRFPKDTSLDYIKRVVGIPGDTVSYRNKVLTVNGVKQEAVLEGEFSYLDDGPSGGSRLRVIKTERYRETLNGREHAVLADPDVPTLQGAPDQFTSFDQCRYDDEGFTCTVPAGHYFMMGDNRDHSSDSRYWGFVPEENIVGKAFLIWMNLGEWKRIGTRIR